MYMITKEAPYYLSFYSRITDIQLIKLCVYLLYHRTINKDKSLSALCVPALHSNHSMNDMRQFSHQPGA